MTKVNFKVWIAALFVAAAMMAAPGCSKEGPMGPAGKDGIAGQDGKDGVNGQDGADGIDGQDGQDGVAGQDGNANVKTYMLPPIYVKKNNVGVEVPFKKGDAVLVYCDRGMLPHIFYGDMNEWIFDAKLSFTQPSTITFTVRSHSDLAYYNQTYSINPSKVWVVVIEPSETNTISKSGQTPRQAVEQELAKAGVDINDYQAVCNYYGVKAQ